MTITGLLMGALLAAPGAQDAPTDWSATLMKDLDAADAAMRGSHPGMVDRQNPGFVAQLDDALARELELLRKPDGMGCGRDLRGKVVD